MTADDAEIALLVEGIFRIDAGGRAVLLVSRCRSCGARSFPPRERCGACSSAGLELEDASRRGELYTWTTIRELGGHRENFTPYTVGQIDLSDGLRVTGVVECEPDKLTIGLALQLCLKSHGHDDDGRRLVGYAFEPV